MWILTGFLLALICAAAANMQAAPPHGNTVRQMATGHLTAALLAASLYTACTAVTARPFTALFLTLSGTGLLWAVNRLKGAVLHEPLLFSDIFLLGQVHRHPQLYIAHAPKSTLLSAALWCGAGVTIPVLEPAQAALSPAVRIGLGLTAGLPWLVLAAMLTGRMKQGVASILAAHDLSFDPDTDAARFTPLGAALLHALHHCRRLREGIDDLLSPSFLSKRTGRDRRPHVLLTQAESFCDIRRFAPDLDASLLPNIREAMARGQRGRMELDWSGAYTMRTEFSVLTGLNIRNMETFGFDPYLLAARYQAPSLARTLTSLGYRSICIHPYDPTFFGRNRVMDNLGFNRFMGLEAFAGAEKNGPYVSDPYVLNTALDLFQTAAEPLFIFVITMEAHGPWLPGRFGNESLHETPLMHYTRHLRSLDRGVGDVLQRAQEIDRELVFGLYGDHLPSLDVVLENAEEDKATDYLVWSSHPEMTGNARKDLRPEMMGNEILRVLGEGGNMS